MLSVLKPDKSHETLLIYVAILIFCAHAQTNCLPVAKIRYYKDVTLCENYVRDFFIAAIFPVSVKFVI